MNNLPKVVTQQRRGRASNPRLLDRKSDALPLSHRATRNYCCRAREVTLSFMDTLIAFTISLTYHQEQDVNEIDRPISKRWRRIDFSVVKIVHNAIILQ